MKNNKRLQYILLAVVILIWGTFIFKVKHLKKENKLNFDAGFHIPNLSESSDLVFDTFNLSINYPDPFLKNTNSHNLKKIGTKKPETPKQRKIQEKNMPHIIYKGYFLEKGKVSRVNIDFKNQSHTLGKNEGIEGVIVKNMHRDHILISWQGKTGTIYRQK